MRYYFQTPYGIFFIASAPYGGYNLLLNEDVINWSNHLDDLVEQMHEKNSGCQEWDSQNELEAPRRIEEWNVKI